MIEEVTGNLFDADVDALVNAVNCVGVMGAGIALQFKRRFPLNFTEYQIACREGEVVPGRMLVHTCASGTGSRCAPRYIINFPTKRHWRDASRLADIDSGLRDLKDVSGELGIKSIAMPALGCGLGGLDWKVVRGSVLREFAFSPVCVLLFGPHPAEDATRR